jgi:hypothetical protein
MRTYADRNGPPFPLRIDLANPDRSAQDSRAPPGIQCQGTYSAVNFPTLILPNLVSPVYRYLPRFIPVTAEFPPR